MSYMLLVELELAVIAVLLAYSLFRGRNKPVSTAGIAKIVAQAYESEFRHGALEIVKRVGGEWVSIGRRHEGHPDVKEALDTPGLAVRHESGEIAEGKQ